MDLLSKYKGVLSTSKYVVSTPNGVLLKIVLFCSILDSSYSTFRLLKVFKNRVVVRSALLQKNENKETSKIGQKYIEVTTFSIP